MLKCIHLGREDPSPTQRQETGKEAVRERRLLSSLLVATRLRPAAAVPVPPRPAHALPGVSGALTAHVRWHPRFIPFGALAQ